MCAQELCEECDDFATEESCTKCIENASVQAGVCTCDDPLVYVADSHSCEEDCHPNCSGAANCSIPINEPAPDNLHFAYCYSCASGLNQWADTFICQTNCATGITPSANRCNTRGTVVNYVFDAIQTEWVDSVSGLVASSDTPPEPLFKRGIWFSLALGQYLTIGRLQLHTQFTIEMWTFLFDQFGVSFFEIDELNSLLIIEQSSFSSDCTVRFRGQANVVSNSNPRSNWSLLALTVKSIGEFAFDTTGLAIAYSTEIRLYINQQFETVTLDDQLFYDQISYKHRIGHHFDGYMY